MLHYSVEGDPGCLHFIGELILQALTQCPHEGLSHGLKMNNESEKQF